MIAILQFRFTKLRTRLAVQYASLFGVGFVSVLLVSQAVIHAEAERLVTAELLSSGKVFDRFGDIREQSLALSAEVVSRDGFRSAVASGDSATIASALNTLKAHSGVPIAAIVGLHGRVTGATGALAAAMGALPFSLPPGTRSAVVAIGNATYRLIEAPILAPTQIGWAVVAVPLDAAKLRGLERLSAIPITTTILHRDARGHWYSLDPALRCGAKLDALVADAGDPATLDCGADSAYAVARPLPGPRNVPQAALLMRYSTVLALAPYRPIQIGIVLAGLAGLLLVVWGSLKLAANIAGPVAALQRAAQALEEGTRTEVPAAGVDEIGQLTESFNRMSAGIIERENRITHLALHDSLTNLPNRAFFRQSLDQGMARIARSGERVAVLSLDLDRFKVINDTLGHPIGDELLRRVGEMLLELAPEGIVSRLGGDEFAIVLDDAFDADRPRALAQAIVDALSEPVAIDGRVIPTGASLGIAIGPRDGADADQLLKNADLALYRAKQHGRGAFCFFEAALDQAARERRQLEIDLRQAIRTGQFQLHYQPIYDLKTERINCFEALLRWDHPTQGDISPTQFIPVAEDCGLIIAIGEWVMHEACRQAIAWPDDIAIAVNVSTLQFRSAGFAQIVFQALARSGLAPRRLEVEITESVFLDGDAPTLDLLHRLHDLGVRVALDDFGTGFSSLSYLRSFPFDKLKIDKSFIDNVAEDSSAAAIVRAIIDLASALHMETTAEGVESAEQLERLRSQGCDSIQGFLFSHPVDGAAAKTLLRSLETTASAA